MKKSFLAGMLISGLLSGAAFAADTEKVTGVLIDAKCGAGKDETGCRRTQRGVKLENDPPAINRHEVSVETGGRGKAGRVRRVDDQARAADQHPLGVRGPAAEGLPLAES